MMPEWFQRMTQRERRLALIVAGGALPADQPSDLEQTLQHFGQCPGGTGVAKGGQGGTEASI